MEPDISTLHKPDISNGVGSVKHIFERTGPFHSEGVVWNPFALRPSIDDHGSFAILRSGSARPIHLFDHLLRP
jgi:hypothetical protein